MLLRDLASLFFSFLLSLFLFFVMERCPPGTFSKCILFSSLRFCVKQHKKKEEPWYYIIDIHVKTDTFFTPFLLTLVKPWLCVHVPWQISMWGLAELPGVRGDGGWRGATGLPDSCEHQNGWTHKLQHMLCPPTTKRSSARHPRRFVSPKTAMRGEDTRHISPRFIARLQCLRIQRE